MSIHEKYIIELRSKQILYQRQTSCLTVSLFPDVVRLSPKLFSIEPDYNPDQEHQGFFERILQPHHPQHNKDTDEVKHDDEVDQERDHHQKRESVIDRAKHFLHLDEELQEEGQEYVNLL